MLATVIKTLFIARLVQAGSIQASLALGGDDLSLTTTYTFTMQVDTALTSSNHFIFEFDADLGIQVPASLNTCTGVTGFTQSSVPCLRLSAT